MFVAIRRSEDFKSFCLKFCLVNKFLRSSLIYGKWRKEFENLWFSLQQQIDSIDYACICSKFLKRNSYQIVWSNKRSYNLLKEKHSTQDSEKVIFNFSKYVLSDYEKSLLTKGLNFNIPCKKLDYADYLYSKF